jgi:hypothetical protein
MSDMTSPMHVRQFGGLGTSAHRSHAHLPVKAYRLSQANDHDAHRTCGSESDGTSYRRDSRSQLQRV